MFGIKTNSRWAVFISGSGSTLQTLIDADLLRNIKLIVTSRAKAPGLLKAKRMGIRIFVFDKSTPMKLLSKELEENFISNIFLAGYMKILDGEFVRLWQEKIFNVHPSLLPNYKGLEAAERSWKDRSKMGASIHYVVSELDAGKIVIQKQTSSPSEQLSLQDSLIFLREGEQFLLRNFASRYLCA